MRSHLLLICLLTSCAGATNDPADAGEEVACADIPDRWLEAVEDPAMTACSEDTDCGVAGGPTRYGGCDPSIFDCGLAVNLQTYDASLAARWEDKYFQECPPVRVICDCPRRTAVCDEGRCVTTHDGSFESDGGS